MKSKLIIVLLLMVFSMSVFSQKEKTEEKKQKEAETIKDMKSAEGPIHFIGKIVDQNGDPVVDATVVYFYNWFCLGHEYFYCEKYDSANTDATGYFEIKAGNAASLNIYKISKDGYDSGQEGRTFKGERNYGISSPLCKYQKQENSSPAIFEIRKKGEPTLLLSSWNDEKLLWKGEEITYAVCFAGRYHHDLLENVASNGSRLDLIVSGRYQDNSYRISFKAVGANDSGVILTEDELFTAPENGYKEVNELLLKDKDISLKIWYLYGKTGNPQIYTKMKMQVTKHDNRLDITYRYYSNPYGDRNLEAGLPEKAKLLGDNSSAEAWSKYLGKKESEALKALVFEKKYPPKYEINELMKEAKAYDDKIKMRQ